MPVDKVKKVIRIKPNRGPRAVQLELYLFQHWGDGTLGLERIKAEGGIIFAQYHAGGQPIFHVNNRLFWSPKCLSIIVAQICRMAIVCA